MKMTNKEYSEYIKKKADKSPMWPNILKAFVVGGLICCLGQGLLQLYEGAGLPQEDAAAATSISLVFLGAFLTGLGVYDDMARFAGAGTLVPITGFANSVVSPALEFRSEGIITGLCAKMFIVAGPVIVSGITASVVYGLLLVLLGY
ncbi:MAG: stage V sporulation protein AC [Oscillospiraceae bacterium]|jgi:stage V sporulation protein AC